ncbi:hypothetical protein HanPSC8_Chr05g0187561 [Helianthus annuus]|nr:hypothetical protein HanPSC8_Chr05g0187561 [Helianthus annuus]
MILQKIQTKLLKPRLLVSQVNHLFFKYKSKLVLFLIYTSQLKFSNTFNMSIHLMVTTLKYASPVCFPHVGRQNLGSQIIWFG